MRLKVKRVKRSTELQRIHKMHKRTILHLRVECDGTCQSKCTTYGSCCPIETQVSCGGGKFLVG